MRQNPASAGPAPVHLLVVPYDSGHRGARMGKGPEHLAGHGAAARLRARGHAVTEDIVELDQSFAAEIASAFALGRAVAERVRAAATAGGFPLVLAGNCNTPETTTGGFLDGMALATLTGRCWRTLAAGVPGFRPVPEPQVLLVGGRDLDAQERVALDGSRILWVSDAQVRERGPAQALGPALEELAGRVGCVYLHIDLDIHDPSYAPANPYTGPGGLDPAEVRDVVRLVAARLPLTAGTLAAYDPGCDVEDRMLTAGLELTELIAGLAPGETPT